MNDDSVLEVVEDLSRGGAILYSTDDRWNGFLARNQSSLSDLDARWPSTSAEAMMIVADKLALWRHCHSVIDMPFTAPLLPGVAAGDGFIIKPRSAFDGLRITKKGFVRGGEVDPIKANGFVMQERISAPLGSHYSLCGLRANEEMYGVALYSKILEYPHPGGTATASIISSDAALSSQLEDKASKLLQALEYQGVFEIEFIHCKKTGRFLVVDVNLRFWLQHELARLLGIDYVQMYSSWLEGRGLVRPQIRKRRVAWVHEGFPLSLIGNPADTINALFELSTRRWLLAHARPDDIGPFWRFLRG
jgi:hypothetical protein